jgi:hypothetical protein
MPNSTLSIPASNSLAGTSKHAPETTGFAKKQRRIWALPGLTGPVILVASRPAIAAFQGTFWRDILSLATDVLQIRAWRDMDPIGCYMLAAYTAAIAQPLVYGNLGSSIMALMTPLK